MSPRLRFAYGKTAKSRSASWRLLQHHILSGTIYILDGTWNVATHKASEKCGGLGFETKETGKGLQDLLYSWMIENTDAVGTPFAGITTAHAVSDPRVPLYLLPDIDFRSLT